MAYRNTLRHGASALSVTLALIGGAMAQPAWAQSTAPAGTPPPLAVDGDEDVQPVTDPDVAAPGEAIIVTGFRESLANSVAEKKFSDQILESVTAEDIGKLPDNSIGESIARLPGITSQRLNGRANVISIRGFGPDFSQTLLNGREQTSTGDNRAVEFDQYPAEVVNQVVVYKTPIAELVGQGLVGTVDVRTIRPLEVSESVIAIGARGSWADIGALNAGSKEFGYRANAAYVDQFADDTIGISLSASYTDEPYQLQEFNSWGYTASPTGAQLIGGSKSFVTSTQLSRLGLTGTLQFQPTPNFTVTADAFYSDFSDDQTKRGVEMPLAFGSVYDPTQEQVEDDTVVAGRFSSVEGVVRNDVFQREAQLFSGGINLRYDNEDGWSGFFDFGYSRTDRRELSFESYSGTGVGGGNGETDDVRFTVGETGAFFDNTFDYSDPSRLFLTDPLGWGGGTQAGYYNDRIIDDELLQYRAHLEKELFGNLISAFKVGVNYTERQKSLTPDEYFVRLAGGVLEAPIPQDVLLRPTSLSYLGLGDVISYDPRDLLESGTLVLDPNPSNDVPAKAYTILEDIVSVYAQADIDQELGSATLTGNLGVQAIHTSQTSSGLAFPGGVQTRVESGEQFWDVLPSLNLSLRFDNDFVVRLGLSRQIQRPRLDDLRIALSYGLDFNPANSPTGTAPFIAGTGGNPLLRPYRANAADLTFEKYFASTGVIALQVFYKDIVSYVDTSQFDFEYAGYPLPAGPIPPSTLGRLTAPNNTGGGTFYGGELAVTLPFDVFTTALEGFGVTGGVGYTETEVEDAFGVVDQIPGYSKWVINGTVFFEQGGFNARASARHRSDFLGDFTGFGGSPTRRQALAETIVDAQLGYDFDAGSLEGLSLYLQGQNLTDQPFVSINANGNPLQVIDRQLYGRRFLAGFTFRF